MNRSYTEEETTTEVITSPICCVEVVAGEYFSRSPSKQQSNEQSSMFGATVWCAHRDGKVTVRNWKDGHILTTILTPLSDAVYQEPQDERALVKSNEYMTGMLHIKSTAQVWFTTDHGRIFIYNARVCFRICADLVDTRTGTRA